MKKKKYIWIMAGLLMLTCFCFGCGQKREEGEIVARINDYKMTLGDFEDEIKHSSYAGVKEPNLEEVLDLAVRKQILIQEAQRQGLDRQKSFMKTIERYWRQTLIKELLQKETVRIYDNVTKDKQDEALKEWMDEVYKKAEIKVYKEVLGKMEAGR